MSEIPRRTGSSQGGTPDTFVRRVLKVVGIVLGSLLLLLLISEAFDVILLILAGTLIAVFFRGTATALSKRTALSERLSLLLVIVFVIAVIMYTFWELYPRVNEQIATLSQELPRALANFRERIGHTALGSRLIEEAPTMDILMESKRNWLKRSLGILSSTFGVLANLYVILFLSLFITAQPGIYKKGIVRLFPIPRRNRATEVMDALGSTLYRWLLGKLFSMLVVGVFTAVGLAILDVPLALVLGLIACLLSFIPNFGPLLALIPAVLIAWLQGTDQALYVILLYSGIQTVESNLITPLVQRKMIAIPPALIIVAQLLLGVFSGVLGLILATPIIAVLMVLVKMLYVQDVLGDEEVEVR